MEEKYNQMYQILEQLVRMVGANNVAVEEMRSDMKEMRADINGLRADVNELRTDVNELRADVNELRADVNQLRTEVNELRADVDELRTEVRALNVRMDKQESTLERIENVQKIQGESLKILAGRQINLESELNLLKQAK